MLTKAVLKDWVVEALKAQGGSAPLIDVAKHIWKAHRADLEQAGDLFFTWQYDMRWAATGLRGDRIMKSSEFSKGGRWELA